MSIGRLIAVIFILVIIAAIGFLVFSSDTSDQGARDAGDAFLQALKDGDFAAAFNLCDPALQAQFGDPTGVQNSFASRQFAPESWNIHDTSVDGDTGTLQASVTLVDDERTGIILDVSKIEGEWRISRVELVGT